AWSSTYTSSYSDSGGGGEEDSANWTAASTLALASASIACRCSGVSMPSRSSSSAKLGIGSRSRHCATSSLVRYCSGSAIECPRKRYVSASTSSGLRWARTRSTASHTTAYVSSTSIPSQR